MPMLMLAAVAAIQVQPTPSSPWQSGLIEDNCAIVRSYASDAGPLLIEITRPVASSQRLRVVLPKSMDAGDRAHQLQITMQPQGRSFVAKDTTTIRIGSGPFREFPDPEAIVETKDGRVVRRVNDIVVESLAAANALEIKIGKQGPIALSTVGASAAVDALNKCFTTKIAAAGLNVSDFVPSHMPAEGINPERWITTDDYPREALASSQQGKVELAFFVEANGRVNECKVLSDTPAALNRTSCELIRQRGRYRPARDAAGKPIRSLQTRIVVWSLPR